MTNEIAAEAGLMTGFPPPPESRVTLANWQDPPFNRWAFRHMREIIPSHRIPGSPDGGLKSRRWILPTRRRRRSST